MKYNVGDKVRIKSKKQFKKFKEDKYGNILIGDSILTNKHKKYLGQTAEVKAVLKELNFYLIDIDFMTLPWNDKMLEDCKEENDFSILQQTAKVIRDSNLSVSVKEEDGKLIIEPLNVNEDFQVDTPVMVATKDGLCMGDWNLRYYAGGDTCFIMGNNSKSESSKKRKWDYIIPFDKFDPNNIEESIKYNIAKKLLQRKKPSPQSSRTRKETTKSRR